MRRMYESAGQIRNLLGRKIKMKIRKLETGEKLNTRKLYEEVFSEDSKDFVDYYYEEKVKDNQIYVVEEDGEIQAMLHLNPYELAVNGSRKDVNYIVAVATRKSYRKRGFMAGASICHLISGRCMNRIGHIMIRKRKWKKVQM